MKSEARYFPTMRREVLSLRPHARRHILDAKHPQVPADAAACARRTDAAASARRRRVDAARTHPRAAFLSDKSNTYQFYEGKSLSELQ